MGVPALPQIVPALHVAQSFPDVWHSYVTGDTPLASAEVLHFHAETPHGHIQIIQQLFFIF